MHALHLSAEGPEAWTFLSYTMQNHRSRSFGSSIYYAEGLQNRDSVPVQGIFVHRSQDARLQSTQSILDSIPGLDVTWTPVYVGQGV